MKTKTISNKETLVCSKCEEEFKEDTNMVCILPSVKVSTPAYTNYSYTINNKAIFMVNTTAPWEELVNDEEFYHKECFTQSNNSLDSIKESLNNLSQQNKQELYNYLYYIHKCRI